MLVAEKSSPARKEPLPLAASLEADTLTRIIALGEKIRAFEGAHAALLDAVDPRQKGSARNLLHYLALRMTDIRALQDDLAELGLSSLGRAEAHTQATVRSVQSILYRLLEKDPGDDAKPTGPSVEEGRRALAANSAALLGPISPGRGVRIMVTMPREAADGPELIRGLVAGGMDLMRINCAHDDEAHWKRMIDHLGRAKKLSGRSCKVLMDLAGPKLRTGPLELEPGVAHWRPRRDVTGMPTEPARVWVRDRTETHRAGADANLEVPQTWIRRLRVGSAITFCDLRGRKRELAVVAVEPHGAWLEGLQTCYVNESTKLVIESAGKRYVAHIRGLAPVERAISLARGDKLILTRALEPGRGALRDPVGAVLEPARIPCSLEAAFQCAKPGEHIWFDDGKIGGLIQEVDADLLTVEITQTAGRTATLGSDKGINLPDTDLSIHGLTDKDERDLQFAVRHADAVSLSFVRSSEDVRALENALQRLHAPAHLGIVLKIETRSGFENLPDCLLAGMTGRPLGVMIARGDLAIECGYERMAELQEEILWISEAAHVPAIWATQVLESLAKKGTPSRAEVTDAAMGARAECVMLNKGPHVLDAVRALDDILRRMQNHQDKKSSRMRGLRLAELLDRRS